LASYTAENLVLDGSGAPWVTGIGNKNAYVVSFDPNGNALSGTTGIVGTTYSNSGGTTVLSRTTGQSSYGIAIDLSGDIWVADGDEGTLNSTTLTSSSIYEIVGSAVPVVTPLAMGVKNGTLATMP
jgi:streptogramin lyase